MVESECTVDGGLEKLGERDRPNDSETTTKAGATCTPRSVLVVQKKEGEERHERFLPLRL